MCATSGCSAPTSKASPRSTPSTSAGGRGGRFALADDLDDFDYLLAEWGYPGAAIRTEIERFNAAAWRWTGAAPRPGGSMPCRSTPRRTTWSRHRPLITFTFGGVLVDDRARALDADGRAIPGLLAAGADAGGLFVRADAGGLAAATVFGLRAAATALDSRGAITSSAERATSLSAVGVGSPTERPLLGQWAVVTGGSMGIGQAIAERFVSGGANVVVVARGQAALDDAVVNPHGHSRRPTRRSSASAPTLRPAPASTALFEDAPLPPAGAAQHLRGQRRHRPRHPVPGDERRGVRRRRRAELQRHHPAAPSWPDG